MTLESKVTIPESLFMQEVDGETILLDANSEEYFSLNETGTMFYKLLKEESSLQDVIEILQETFEISKEQLERDLLSFTTALQEKKLLVVV